MTRMVRHFRIFELSLDLVRFPRVNGIGDRI